MTDDYGALWGIARREAVQVENGESIVLDPTFLLRKEVRDSQGDTTAIVLFTTKAAAARFVEVMRNPANVVGSFRNAIELIAHLEECPDRWVKTDQIPGVNDGFNIKRETVIEELKRRVGNAG